MRRLRLRRLLRRFEARFESGLCPGSGLVASSGLRPACDRPVGLSPDPSGWGGAVLREHEVSQDA